MIACVGLASGIGAANPGCGAGPLFLQQNICFESLGIRWHEMIVPEDNELEKRKHLFVLNEKLANVTRFLAENHRFFLTIGGDHSCAVGTWTGVAEAHRDKGDIGLIWIDAHMDSHTPTTSLSGNFHGMPLAALFGYGDPILTSILSCHPKVKPSNVALIGIRSYEEGEEELLKSLNVKIYHMEEVQKRGLRKVIEEAVCTIAAHTVGYGISFDLDSIDPSQIAAVGTPVPGGICAEEILNCCDIFTMYPPLAFELVEYNPSLDTNKHTLEFIQRLLQKTCHFYHEV